MNKLLLSDVLKKLQEFEAASPYNTSEIEATRDALASAIGRLVRAKQDEPEPESLADAIDKLPIAKEAKAQLFENLNELDELVEASDYDSTEEDPEDKISELKTDFYDTLERELKKL